MKAEANSDPHSPQTAAPEEEQVQGLTNSTAVSLVSMKTSLIVIYAENRQT